MRVYARPLLAVALFLILAAVAGATEESTEPEHAGGPMYTIDLRAENEEGVTVSRPLEFFKGDTVNGAMARFASVHGVAADRLPGLTTQVLSYLVTEKVIPLVDIPVVVVEGHDPVPFRLYKGEDVAAAVSAFAEAHSLNAAQAAAVTAEAQKRAVASGALPMADYKYTTRSGLDLSLPLYAGGSVKAAVESLAATHGLESEEATQLYRDVSRQLVTQGLAPALVVPTLLASGGDAPLDVFVNETVGAAIERFAAAHGPPALGPTALTAKVTAALVSARLLPVVEAVVGLGGVEMPIRVFAGDDPDAVARAFLAHHGVDADAGVNDPAGSESGGSGDADVTDSGAGGGAPGPTLATQLAASLRKRMIAARALPLATIAVPHSLLAEPGAESVTESVTESGGAESGTEPVIEFFEGDAIGDVVTAWADAQALAPPTRAALLAHAQRALAAGRHVPLLVLEATADGAPVTVAFYTGDDPATVAATALESAGLGPGHAPALAGALRQRLIESRLMPVAELDLAVNGTHAPLPVYAGDDLGAAVERFRAAHKLTAGATPELTKLIGGRLQALRLLPLATVPVTLPTGVESPLPLYEGDNLEAAVSAFATNHGLSDESVIGELTATLRTRLQRQRLLPLLSLPISAGGPGADRDNAQGAEHNAPSTLLGELAVFEGDTVAAAAESFRVRHGLPPAAAAELERLVTTAAKAANLLPRPAPEAETGAQGAEPGAVAP